MKSKDFKEAVDCYTKALESYNADAATYSNRALAYLKLKEYARALEDAEAAIKLKDDYIKAYHRRGKAYAALNKLELAIRDFQFILEKEPNNKDAMQEVKSARKKLQEKLGTSSTPTPSSSA
jgi:tetratricopeptide (TPR) repeat protein